jgi:hypothetical protein
MDDAFTTTWYEIKPDAIDNILEANVIWAALEDAGCRVPQEGGRFIEETIRYGKETVTAVSKGDSLGEGEPELETVALWTWRYIAGKVQRSIFDDQINRGKSKIKSYLEPRMAAVREALVEHFDDRALGAIVTDESGKEPQGLNDIVPPYASRATGYYGKIARSNSWWVPKYKAASATPETDLLDDMNNLFNTISANKIAPDLLVTGQTWFEIYQNFAVEASQLVKEADTHLADLGYDVLRFRGKRLIWVPDADIQISSKNQMLMLSTPRIKVVYDPGMWFDMTEWKPIAKQGERLAHILCTLNMTSNELRRHGRLYET